MSQLTLKTYAPINSKLKHPEATPLAFELFKACLVRFFFCPQQRLPLGIPLSHALFLFLSPQLPYDTKRPLRRREKFSLQITPWQWSNASLEEEMFCKYMACGLMKSKCLGRLKVSRAYISSDNILCIKKGREIGGHGNKIGYMQLLKSLSNKPFVYKRCVLNFKVFHLIMRKIASIELRCQTPDLKKNLT